MNQPAEQSHLAEDDLILHYYGELAAPGEATTEAHLRSCPACRNEYTALQRILGAVDETSLSQVDLPPSFERTVWARLEPNLRKHRRWWASWLFLSPAPLGLAVVVVVLVAGAFFAGRALAPAPPASAPSAAGLTADQIRERILLVDLGQHLDRSEMVLIELVSSEATDSADISEERARVEQLLADNRLYRHTADDTGNAGVSVLLDEIDRVLTELAAGPDRLSAQDLADMRRRIEMHDLLFKVRVVSSEVRQRQKETIQRKVTQES